MNTLCKGNLEMRFLNISRKRSPTFPRSFAVSKSLCTSLWTFQRLVLFVEPSLLFSPFYGSEWTFLKISFEIFIQGVTDKYKKREIKINSFEKP